MLASGATVGALSGCLGAAQEGGQGEGQYSCPDGYSLLAKFETGGGDDCFTEDEEENSIGCIEIVDYTTKEGEADDDCDEIVEFEWVATGDCVVYQIRVFGGGEEAFDPGEDEVFEEGQVEGTFTFDTGGDGPQPGISNVHFCGVSGDDGDGGDGDGGNGDGGNGDGGNGDGGNGDGGNGDDGDGDGDDEDDGKKKKKEKYEDDEKREKDENHD
ncbi:hypothetical protein [Halosolutus halophilus]|uniref:hypothetical protein n=1 Tax=Halosolutus halophilus TaxID=1552990 RepID=UPI0022350E3E|nr:hypothetical protein [Halosolutus halophilus]